MCSRTYEKWFLTSARKILMVTAVHQRREYDDLLVGILGRMLVAAG